MTNLFICKRTAPVTVYGITTYHYQELAPVEDLERVREALEAVMPFIGYEANVDDLKRNAKEALEILNKINSQKITP